MEIDIYMYMDAHYNPNIIANRASVVQPNNSMNYNTQPKSYHQIPGHQKHWWSSYFPDRYVGEYLDAGLKSINICPKVLVNLKLFTTPRNIIL